MPKEGIYLREETRTMSKNRYATRKRTTAGRAETLRRREIRRFKYQGSSLIGKTEK